MKSNKTLLYGAAGVVLVAALSFFAGMQLQKSLNHNPNTQASAGQNGGGGSSGGGYGGFGGRGGGGQRGNAVFGTVQSVTSTSMVVTTQSGTTTVSLTGNPTVTDGSGNSASISSIQTGDTVVAFGTAGSDGTVTATRIRLNPSFGGGGGGGSSDGNSASGT